MRALRLTRPAPIEQSPLAVTEVAPPHPGPGEFLLRVRACAICRTDLHTVEGELRAPRLPITPGHQAVGIVEQLGEGVRDWSVGDRAGVPWLFRACGSCEFCRRGDENLCPDAEFTGLHQHGGYAAYMVADARFALRLPSQVADEHLAPLLCAGIIGYRALRKADLQPGERLGLIGFGASAHLALQVARSWGCEVYVYTRGEGHRRLASRLGASWVGGLEDRSPALVDKAVQFAPVGALVPRGLEKIRPGGTLAINAVYLSPIPEFPYALLYGERTLRSVANATRRDGEEFLALAFQVPILPSIRTYPLRDANTALLDLKRGEMEGAGVLIP